MIESSSRVPIQVSTPMLILLCIHSSTPESTHASVHREEVGQGDHLGDRPACVVSSTQQ